MSTSPRQLYILLLRWKKQRLLSGLSFCHLPVQQARSRENRLLLKLYYVSLGEWDESGEEPGNTGKLGEERENLNC